MPGHSQELDILRELRREYLKEDAAGDASRFAQIARTPLRTCLADRVLLERLEVGVFAKEMHPSD